VDQLELAEIVLAPEILTETVDTVMSQEHLECITNSTDPQYQLPSMPEDGLLTPVVSSPTVTPVLITPSYLLVTQALIPSSKTHGVLSGVKPVISD